MRARNAGLAILYPFRCRIGSTAPSCAGLRNLFECQAAASGPVSASPSPITQATIRSGLSNAALVYRTRRFWGHMAGNSPRKGKLPEQPLHPFLVLRDLRINLAVGALQPGIRHDRRTAVPGSGDVDHVEVEFADQPVEMRVDQVEPGASSPVAQQTRLDVMGLDRLTQQRVVEQVNLADAKIVGGAPPGADRTQLVCRKNRGNGWIV